MLTFLRINSLFQLLTLGFALMLIKLPFLGNKLPLLLPELEWMLVGERLNNGFSLYQDTWTSVAPLSGFVYQLIDLGFGRDKTAYEFAAYALVFIQAIFLTYLTNRRQLLLEKNYVVGMVYIVLLNSSFDMSKLSPMLLATTFILLALNGFLKQVDSREGVSDDIFEVGLFIGVATMFYLPMSLFMLWAGVAALFFTGANFRQMILILLGFLLPIFAVAVYFYFTSDFQTVLFNVLEGGSFHISQFSLANTLDTIYTFVIPFAVAAVGYWFLSQANRYSGYQNRSHQTILLGIGIGLLTYFIGPIKTPMQLIPILPFLAIFIAGFFLHFKGIYQPELLFVSFIAIVLLIGYQGVMLFFGDNFKHLSELRVQNQRANIVYDNKKMLITGERIDEYKFGKPSTCYLNWQLAKHDLQNPNNYASVVNIFYNFEKEKPEVILDKEGVVPSIFKRIPELAKQYEETSQKGVYVRKK